MFESRSAPQTSESEETLKYLEKSQGFADSGEQTHGINYSGGGASELQSYCTTTVYSFKQVQNQKPDSKPS